MSTNVLTTPHALANIKMSIVKLQKVPTQLVKKGIIRMEPFVSVTA